MNNYDLYVKGSDGEFFLWERYGSESQANAGVAEIQNSRKRLGQKPIVYEIRVVSVVR